MPDLAVQLAALRHAADGEGSGNMNKIWMTARIFLPFAAGYYLSYVFRTINAAIADRLTSDMSLNATDLGLLTSVYFLSFASVQLPVGAALDRYGPRRVQSTLLLLAAAGAALFAEATTLPGLLLGRALVGLGVAGALMAGLKAIVLWLPKERLALANGAFIALGTAGAVTATEPVELFLASSDWRHLFALLAALTAATALAIAVLAPNAPAVIATHRGTGGLQTAYRDLRFWRLAPLSASIIGTAWALQGLWAAPWLADVAALQHDAVVHQLFVMAVALCVGALLIGVAADRLRLFGVTPGALLVVFAICFVAAELVLVLRVPIAASVPWAVIAATGAATVLSFAILADYFAPEIAGRANAALGLFHVSGAFVVQSVFGLIIEMWPRDAGGHYPASAYAAAFGATIVLQVASLIWFLVPRGARLEAPAASRATPQMIGEALAAESAPPTSDHDTIRSAFVARAAASRVASIGSFAQIETTDDGFAVRGAYRAHLSVSVEKLATGDPAAEGDVLRKAYLARIIADAAAQPRPRRHAARPPKRSAGKPGRTAPGTKGKTRVPSTSPANAKKRSPSRTKPRAAARPPLRGN
jgi:MFS family permease